MPGTFRRRTAALWMPMAIADTAMSAWVSMTSRSDAVRYVPTAKAASMAASSASAHVTAGGHGPVPRIRSTMRAPMTSPTPKPRSATSARSAAAALLLAEVQAQQHGIAGHVRGEDAAEPEIADRVDIAGRPGECQGA